MPRACLRSLENPQWDPRQPSARIRKRAKGNQPPFAKKASRPVLEPAESLLRNLWSLFGGMFLEAFKSCYVICTIGDTRLSQAIIVGRAPHTDRWSMDIFSTLVCDTLTKLLCLFTVVCIREPMAGHKGRQTITASLACYCMMMRVYAV